MDSNIEIEVLEDQVNNNQIDNLNPPSADEHEANRDINMIGEDEPEVQVPVIEVIDPIPNINGNAEVVDLNTGQDAPPPQVQAPVLGAEVPEMVNLSINGNPDVNEMPQAEEPEQPPEVVVAPEVNNNENDDNNNAIYLREHLRIQQQYQEHIQALHAIAEAEDNFLETIRHLNLENRKLEHKINEADAQNNLLQMQLRVIVKKMENLESFMASLNALNDEEEDINAENDGHGGGFLKKSNCPRCGFHLKLKKEQEQFRRSESIENETFGGIDPSYRPNWKGDSSVTSDSEDITNPMMIDLVVAKIMAYLPPPSLIKCRLINHLWNSEAAYQLRRKHTFKLNFDNIESISRFSAPETSDCLFGRLKLDLGFVVNPFRDYLTHFFATYGPSMTYFGISCEEEFPNRIYTEELRNIFLTNFDQLTELEISLPTKITEKQSIYEDVRPRNRFVYPQLKSLILNQFDNSGGYSVWFTKELLKMAPNLQSLRVETHSKEVITRILLALGDRECRSVTGSLKHLYLDAFVTQQHLEMLNAFEISLVSLQFSLFTVEVTKETVEGVLNKHRHTLTSLILGDYQKRPSQAAQPLVLRLPVMNKLKVLKFVDPCFPDQRNLLLNPLSYTAQLPQLERIIFDHESGKPSGVHLFSDLFNGSPSPCLTLKELKVSHGLTDPNLVIQAAKMFPNLERLDVANLPDAVLREIWANFTEILDLRLELCPVNINVDSVITGIPFEVCKKIQERNLYNQVEAMDVLDIIRTEASICNMTKLRTLKIEGLPSTLLTAVTGYLALSQLKTLSSISIKSDVATLSRECRRVLGERLKLTNFELF